MPILPAVATSAVQARSALDYIKSAMRMIRILEAGEEVKGTDGKDALVILNDMMDGWNAEQLMTPGTLIQDFPLIAGQQTYTLGPAGNFDVVRPSIITGASIVVLTNPSVPVEVPIPIETDDNWQENYPVKNVAGSFPLAVYDDQDFPQRTLTFWPIPGEVDTFRLYSRSPVAGFADLTSAYDFPPSYAEAIRYNLALRLADEWGGTLGQTIVAGAMASLARLKVSNVEIETLKCDEAVTGSDGGNYRADMFNIP